MFRLALSACGGAAPVRFFLSRRDRIDDGPSIEAFGDRDAFLVDALDSAVRENRGRAVRESGETGVNERETVKSASGGR